MKKQSIIKLLFGTLGAAFAYSCDNEEEDALVMYGTPWSEYEIKGTVTDEDGKPIEGAEIKTTAWQSSNTEATETSEGSLFYHSCLSDKNGTFTTGNIKNTAPNKLKVKCTDPSGKYESMEKWAETITKKPTDKDKEDKGFWYCGKNTYKATFIMKKVEK